MTTDWQDTLKRTLDPNSLVIIETRFVRTTRSQTQFAKWMLDRWMPIDLVMTVTGLPLEKVVSIELEMGYAAWLRECISISRYSTPYSLRTTSGVSLSTKPLHYLT